MHSLFLLHSLKSPSISLPSPYSTTYRPCSKCLKEILRLGLNPVERTQGKARYAFCPTHCLPKLLRSFTFLELPSKITKVGQSIAPFHPGA